MKFDFVLKIDLQIQKGLWSIRPVSGQKSINSSISRLGVLISKLKKRKQEREREKKKKNLPVTLVANGCRAKNFPY